MTTKSLSNIFLAWSLVLWGGGGLTKGIGNKTKMVLPNPFVRTPPPPRENRGRKIKEEEEEEEEGTGETEEEER